MDVDAGVHILAATGLGRGSVAHPMLGCLYPQKSLRTHFTGVLVGLGLRASLNMKE